MSEGESAAADSYPANASTWTIDTRKTASIALDVHVEAECLQANFAVQSQIASQTAQVFAVCLKY